jgi:hypothetical protein
MLIDKGPFLRMALSPNGKICTAAGKLGTQEGGNIGMREDRNGKMGRREDGKREGRKGIFDFFRLTSGYILAAFSSTGSVWIVQSDFAQTLSTFDTK